MLPTKNLQKCCPRCSSWHPGVRTRGLSHAAAPVRAGAAVPVSKRQRAGRPYSTAGPAPQRPGSDQPPASREDLEQTVRQAKQAFRDTLPPGYLSPEEYRLYERMYGPPLRKTGPEDVGLSMRRDSRARDADADQTAEPAALEEEPVDDQEPVLDPEAGEDALGDAGQAAEHEAPEGPQPTVEEGSELSLYAKARNQRQFEALLQLQKDFEAANLRAEARLAQRRAQDEEEDMEEDEDEDVDPEDEPDAVFVQRPRVHPFTEAAKFGTNPTTVYLPKTQFVEPITELLKRTSSAHIKAASEKAFGGRGLPFSPATPDWGRALPQKAVAMQPTDHKLSGIEADAYIASVLPGVYASVKGVLTEVRKRLGSEWIKGLVDSPTGPRVLDAGAAGAGLMAWQDVLQAEYPGPIQPDVFNDDQPAGKKTVVVSSDELRHRISRFLHDTTFLPRLPDYVHSAANAQRQLDSPEVPQPRKIFDVVIATHMLMPLEKPHRRRQLLDNLWSVVNPDGGILIVLEKGHPRGFEAVADVRMRILDEFIRAPGQVEEIRGSGEEDEDALPREPGMIIAPCTNHTKCPMYRMPGLTPGRKDFCHFNQRFIRPSFLQSIHEGRDRNHEDISFSYLAVRRGRHPEAAHLAHGREEEGGVNQHGTMAFAQGTPAADRAFAGYGNQQAGTGGSTGVAPHPLSLPRNVLPPLKAKGHVTLDLCTPAGTLERWVVPRSFSKQAYHDARKARWGDLWALGAKTRTRRNPRLGHALARTRAEADAAAREGLAGDAASTVLDIENVPVDKGVRARRAAQLVARGSRSRTTDGDLDAIGPDGRVAAGRRTKRGTPTAATRMGKELVDEDEDEDDEDAEEDRELERLERMMQEDLEEEDAIERRKK